MFVQHKNNVSLYLAKEYVKDACLFAVTNRNKLHLAMERFDPSIEKSKANDEVYLNYVVPEMEIDYKDLLNEEELNKYKK